MLTDVIKNNAFVFLDVFKWRLSSSLVIFITDQEEGQACHHVL